MVWLGLAIAEGESENLKQIRKRTHCAIRRSKFLIQFKYEKNSTERKKLLKAAAKKCAQIKLRINNPRSFFFFSLLHQSSRRRSIN